MRKHKQLSVRAFVHNPIRTEEEVRQWLIDLVAAIDMKIMAGPFTVYAEEEINQGWTGVVVIEFSDASIHIWEREGLVEVDVFSCKDFDNNAVFEQVKKFAPVKMWYQEVDREKDFIEYQEQMAMDLE